VPLVLSLRPPPEKYNALIDSGNIQDIFADTVYRRRSGMEDFRQEIMAELDKKPARTAEGSGGSYRGSLRAEAEPAAGNEVF
jgi:hypothetical protein